MRVYLFVIALTAAAALWVGCGGGSAGSSGGATGTAAAGGENTTAEGGGASGGGEGKRGGGEASGGEGGGGHGSGSNGGTKPSVKSGPLTKTEFIAEGDGICNDVPTQYGLKLSKLKAEKGKGQEPTTAEINLKAAVPPLYSAVEEFEALTPPKGDEKKTEALIAALEKGAKGLEAQPESELTGPTSPLVEFQKLAQQYGFQFCPEL
jgi:hypothetical protein